MSENKESNEQELTAEQMEEVAGGIQGQEMTHGLLTEIGIPSAVKTEPAKVVESVSVKY